jgi:hypothetical protein
MGDCIKSVFRPYGASVLFHLVPTAYAVGFILLPLRGSILRWRSSFSVATQSRLA